MRRDSFQGIAGLHRRSIASPTVRTAMSLNALTEHFDRSTESVTKHIKGLTVCQFVKQECPGRKIYFHLNQKTERSRQMAGPSRTRWGNQI